MLIDGYRNDDGMRPGNYVCLSVPRNSCIILAAPKAIVAVCPVPLPQPPPHHHTRPQRCHGSPQPHAAAWDALSIASAQRSPLRAERRRKLMEATPLLMEMLRRDAGIPRGRGSHGGKRMEMREGGGCRQMRRTEQQKRRSSA